MAEQLGQPARVRLISLAAGNILHVSSIDQEDCEVPFEQILNGVPIFAGTLHRYVGNARLSQPIDKP